MEIKKHMHKHSNKQKAWNFMRRNKRYRVGDMMCILELSESNTRVILSALQKRGYIMAVNKTRNLKDKEFIVVRANELFFPRTA